MKIDPQLNAVRAVQGALPVEGPLLNDAFVGPPAPTSSPGVNTTRKLQLSSGAIVFHKPFSGVHVANAIAYGQTDETPPLHDAVAWRLAVALGEPWRDLVAPCVLRDFDGEDGSLSLQASGWPGDPAPTMNPQWCLPAAFFDALIAQQDRHSGNWRWDGTRLKLIDHGYAFARPGDIANNFELVKARRAGGAVALLAQERDALQRLIGAPDLLGLEAVPAGRSSAGAGRSGEEDAGTRRCARPRRVLDGHSRRPDQRDSIITQEVNLESR